MGALVMKTLYRIALLVGLVGMTSGVQLCAEGPIITRSIVPAVGRTISHQAARVASVSIGAAGPNATWDYTSLTDSGAVFTETYMAAAGTPAQSLFPQANIAVQTQQSSIAYTYFYVDDSKMEAYGTASSSDTDRMSNPRLITTFPRSYQSSLRDEFAGVVSGSSGIVYSAIDSSYVDGYGSLKLPHGLQYDNVARVVSYLTYTMAYSTDTTQKLTMHMIYYSHFSPSYTGGSLLSVHQISFAGFGTRTTSAEYVSAISDDVSNENTALSFSLLPQPAQEYLRIVGTDPSDRIGLVEIYDQCSALVQRFDAGSHSNYLINTTSLASGVYMLRVEYNGRTSQHTLCIIH